MSYKPSKQKKRQTVQKQPVIVKSATERIWPRNDILAAIGVVVMITGVLLALVVPEARKFIGLDRLNMVNPGDTLNIYKGHNADVVSLDWSSLDHVTSVSRDGVKMEWSPITGTNTRTISVPDFFTKQQILSPDTKYTAYVTRPLKSRFEYPDILEVKDNTGKSILWDANSRSNVSQIDFAEIADFEWSPDSTRFAIVDLNRIQVWSIVAGHLLTRYSVSDRCPDACGITMSWSPDSKNIVSASHWETPITVWVADTGEAKKRVSYGCYPDSIQWDKQIVIATHDTCDINSHSELIFLNAINSVGFIDAIEKDTAFVCPNTDSNNYSSDVGWKWSPNKRYIAYPCPGSSYIYVWDSVSRQIILVYKEHSKSVQAMAWSVDSTRIVSSSDSTVRVWQVVKTS